MPSAEFDFLVLGQGLAGSILAHQLIDCGQRVMVIDHNHHASSSMVAAGIINPITGHRLTQSESFDQYFASAQAFYGTLEDILDIKLLRSVDQVRLIKDSQQANRLAARLSQASYAKLFSNNSEHHFSNNEFGATNIHQTFIVDTNAMLSASKARLIENNSIQCLEFDYTALEAFADGFKYDDIAAKKIIFCEGYQAVNNPWLQDLPFKLAKGEILTVELSQDQQPQTLDAMLSWGNWLVPYKDRAKLGSTFVWDDLDLTPSKSTKRMLLRSVHEHTNLSASVLKHEVGIRPSTRQRKPFIGPLSNLQNAYCFNGFGSKGCLQMPYYADLLVNHLLRQTELPKEIRQWL